MNSSPWDDPAAGGLFGRWASDGDGLPCFDVDQVMADVPAAGAGPVVPEAGGGRVWHGVGSAGITALCRADGSAELWWAARGQTRLSGERSWWGIDGLERHDVCARWGLGYAEWTARCGGADVVRRLSVEPGSESVVRIDVAVRGASTGRGWAERWPVEPRSLLVGALMSRAEPPPPSSVGVDRVVWRSLARTSHTVRWLTEVLRTRMSRSLLHPPAWRDDLGALVAVPRRALGPVDRPAWWDRALPALFVAPLDDEATWADGDTLVVALPTPGPDGWSRLALAVGAARDPAELVGLARVARHRSAGASSQRWAGAASLSVDGRPGLARETTWHGAALVGLEQDDDLLGRYVSQGSAYAFVHGLQGAPRDYALSAVALELVDADAARRQLEVMLRLSRATGALHYAHTGRGRTTSGGIHAAPTDLPIWLLWAMSEHAFVAGDDEWLDRPVGRFVGRSEGRSTTPRDRMRRAARYLVDQVGTGSHGMLRVGSGDWSDPISAMVPDRRAFHERGESGFNTAFAAYVLPRSAPLVALEDPETAQDMVEMAVELRAAMLRAWNGQWFLRGWDGSGGPVGAEHLFLDGQVWALIAGIGDAELRTTLVSEIDARCLRPSRIGPTILDRPHPVRFGMLAPGWDCNGGVWAAIGALVAWGIATVDPEMAWRCLAQQSLAAHALAYPRVWYGIWSGPDAYNSHLGHLPGETFVQPATPMREFPVMNSNAHAGPLLAVARVLGLESSSAGLDVVDRGPRAPAWRWATAAGTFERT